MKTLSPALTLLLFATTGNAARIADYGHLTQLEESPLLGEVDAIIKKTQKNSMPVGGNLYRLTVLMQQLVHSAEVFRGGAPSRSELSRPVFGLDGKVKENLHWQVHSGIWAELKQAALDASMELRFVALMHEAAGLFAQETAPGKNLGFWYTLAVFRNDSGARLVAVSSRGTQGFTEILADVGLYQDSVMKETSAGTQVALWGAKQFIKASKDLQATIGEEIAKQLEQDMLSRDIDDVDAMAKQARRALLRGASRLAETLHAWGWGEREAFGTRLGSRRPRFIFCGHSIGGLSAAAVGLKLKSLQIPTGDEQVAVVSTNSPGLKPFLSELGISGKTLSSGWINLVTQHDVVWKIGGDLVKQGQTICMYLHPAEETNCSTGDPKFPRWEKLSDSIRSDCLNGLDVPSIASLLGIQGGNGVLVDAWKCLEFFQNCWPLEHNFDFGLALNKPLLKPDATVHELMAKTGKTALAQNEGHGRADLLAAEAQEAQAHMLQVAEINQNYSEERLSMDPRCENDLSKDFCCVGDGLGHCSDSELQELRSSFHCHSGQGEAFKSYLSNSRNTFEACAAQCLSDSRCKGFDFTRMKIKDACRLYGLNKERKEGDSGWEKRYYCVKQKAGFHKAPRLPCNNGPKGSICNGRCRCPIGKCLSVKEENAFGKQNYRQWECVRAWDFFGRKEEEVALAAAEVAAAKALRELRRGLWQKASPSENWGWACAGM